MSKFGLRAVGGPAGLPSIGTGTRNVVNFLRNSAAPNTYYTALNLNSSGFLIGLVTLSLVLNRNTGAGQYATIVPQVTVDGVALSGLASIDMGYNNVDTYIVPIRFESSLIIRASTTNLSNSNPNHVVRCDIHYLAD